MDRFVVALPHFHQVGGKISARRAPLDVFREITALAFDVVGVFVERLEQF